MGKRILSVTHTGIEVMVRCSDNSIYHGDILVGADGAYSAVRQCMHRDLKSMGMLPRSDSEPLKFDQNCVVGITDPLPTEKFPALKEQVCELYGIMGNKRPYTVSLTNTQKIECLFFRIQVLILSIIDLVDSNQW